MLLQTLHVEFNILSFGIFFFGGGNVSWNFLEFLQINVTMAQRRRYDGTQGLGTWEVIELAFVTLLRAALTVHVDRK